MDTIFADYKLYYLARMQRWQSNEHYPNAYAAEKALYELVASCNNMEELQGKSAEFTALSLQNAIALVKDQENIRKKMYDECKETIRAQAPAAILAKIDSVKSDMELVSMVNEVQQQNSIDITIDQLVNVFYNDFVALENIEVYSSATIPDEWKADCARYEGEIILSGRALWQQTELPAAKQWKPDWEMDYTLLYEERHRRLIPINDREFDIKIALHKVYKTA